MIRPWTAINKAVMTRARQPLLSSIDYFQTYKSTYPKAGNGCGSIARGGLSSVSSTRRLMQSRLRNTARDEKMTTKKPMSTRALVARHPWLAGFNDWPTGWNGLIDELATQIEARHADQAMTLNAETFRLRQVKEKFGELRFYCDSAISVADLTHAATLRSTSICEECGATGQFMQNTRQWLRTLCPEHAGKDFKARRPLTKIELDGTTFTFLDNGQSDAVLPSLSGGTKGDT